VDVTAVYERALTAMYWIEPPYPHVAEWPVFFAGRSSL
jgi:hypothetical protein